MAENFCDLPQKIEREKLINLVPHKSKMFLLDHVTNYDTEAYTLESESLVTKEHLFYDARIDGIPSYVAFEMIAQSVSALSGIIGCKTGSKVRSGFLLSLGNYSASVPYFKVGNSIHIKVKSIDKIGDILTYSGEAYSSENLETPAVSTTINVMETENLNILKDK